MGSPAQPLVHMKAPALEEKHIIYCFDSQPVLEQARMSLSGDATLPESI